MSSQSKIIAFPVNNHSDLSVLSHQERELLPPQSVNLKKVDSESGEQDRKRDKHSDRSVGANFHAAKPHYSLGKALAKKGEWEKAISSYRKALDIDSDSAEIYQNLGDVLVKNGELDEAVIVYHKAIELQPNLWEVHHNLGDIWQGQGRLDEAVAAYRLAIELNPDFCWSHNNLGDVLIKQEKWEEAITAYGRAIELNPDFHWSHYNLGAALVELERWDEAIGAYREAMQLQPDLPQIEEKFNLALHQQVKLRLELALSHYRQAIERDPTDVESYQKALELQPNDVELYLGLGAVLVAKGQQQKAIEVYQQASEINPRCAATHWQLAEVLMQTGQTETARQSQLQALKLEPHRVTSEVYLELGNSLRQQDRLEQAADCYRLAIRQYPSCADAYSRLGELLTIQHHWSEAIACYRQLLKQYPENLEYQSCIREVFAKQNSSKDSSISKQYLPEFYDSVKLASSSQEISHSTFDRNGNTSVTLKTASIAALTIVSKNYLSLARVLCKTFLQHHPQAQFFVLLVDKVDGYFDPEQELFTLLTLSDIDLPSADTFPFRYTIVELNTAVKPFVLMYLFKKYEIDNLLYIDPDIQIFRPLDEVYNALETHSVVLTPHMRKPFRDRHFPSEVQILQSGTYNLGFIGLKRHQTAMKLLEWWMEKLYLDCVVDIPNGLFVDQKWMDLVPAYFPDTYILHDPSYNVAYWNLHERTVEKISDEYLVEGRPLAFFHFSGYYPLQINKLSKHQTRHELLDIPSVKELCDRYGERLLKCGYVEVKDFPYAYDKLSNGIKVNELMNFVLRQCIKQKVPFPSPETNADEFCKFLMTPSPALSGKNTPPIITALFNYRPDVAAYFSNAVNNFLDEGLIDWILEHGAAELHIEELCQRFKQCWYAINIMEDVTRIASLRTDVVNAYPNFVSDRQQYENFCGWLVESGTVEENLDISDLENFKKARGGFYKVLNFYFLRFDLQSTFCNIHLPHVREQFVQWLKSNLNQLENIDINECVWFDFVCEQQPHQLVLINLMYNSHLRSLTGSDGNLFDFNKFVKVLDIGENKGFKNILLNFLTSDKAPAPLSQLEAFYRSQGLLLYLFPQAFQSQEQLLKLYDYVIDRPNLHHLPLQNKKLKKWLERLQAEVQAYNPDRLTVNVAGHFDATTGMGQACRAIAQSLAAVKVNYAPVIVPSTHIHEDTFFDKENKYLCMGWPFPGQGVNITVVNADSVEHVRKVLPSCYWQGRKNIGYWLWETEELPLSQAKSAMGYHEIWTSSEYSAAAIRKSIEKPVRVVPCAIDCDELSLVQSDRQEFNLPEDRLLFGFLFDQKSGLERKNPRGLLQAFRKAFGNSDDVALVLKVNSPVPGNYDYEMLKLESQGLNVIWIEETFERSQTMRLMHCFDLYISLHRSEGFGLTLAEAMAMGKPVIATNYSANLDFMDNSNSFLVEAKVIETDRSYGPYSRGTRWADPDLDRAAQLMRMLCDDSLRSKYGQLAQQSIQQKLSPSVVGDTVSKLLRSLIE